MHGHVLSLEIIYFVLFLALPTEGKATNPHTAVTRKGSWTELAMKLRVYILNMPVPERIFCKRVEWNYY